MLDIFVNTNKLTIKDPIIASDTIEYLTCKVHYESELWEEYDEITAFISNGTTSYSVPVVDGVISEDNKIKVSEGMWTIYIQGTSGGAVVLFTNADILWVTKPGGIEGYPYIKVPADISFQSYLIAKNAEYFALNAGGGSAFKGEVATLPEKANKGAIYKLTTESVPTGKLFIKVSGVNAIEQNPDLGDGYVYTGSTMLDIDTNTDIYQFLLYAKGGYYSEFGVSFDSYIENAGVKYTVPWITTSSFGNDSDDILIDTNKSFEALLVNGNNLVCYADDMTYLPQTLKDNFIKYPAGTCFVYDGTKWVALDSAVLAELALRISGGTSGAMVFKDVVSELPETANEGEVYKVDGYMNEYVGWAFESYDDTFKIYPDRIEFGTEAEIYAEVFNVIYKANGAMVNLELFNYDTGKTHTIAATKAENNILYGATNVASGYVVGSGTMEFKQVGYVKKTCVRFNGEWVEL